MRAPLGVGRGAVEGAVLRRAVALGGHHDAVVRLERVGPLEQEDVGLLAGLEDAELGVDRALGGHDPVGARLGTALQRLDGHPGRPALAVVEVVVGVEVEDERRIDPAERVDVGVAVGEEIVERVNALGVCSEDIGGGAPDVRGERRWTCRRLRSSCRISSHVGHRPDAGPSSSVAGAGAGCNDFSDSVSVCHTEAPAARFLGYVAAVLTRAAAALVALGLVVGGSAVLRHGSGDDEAEAAPAAPSPGVGSPGIGDPYFPLDGNGGIDVLSYAVHDRYRFGSGRLSGRHRRHAAHHRSGSELVRPRLPAPGLDGHALDRRRHLQPPGTNHELRITAAPPDPGRPSTSRSPVSVRRHARARTRYAGESNWVADRERGRGGQRAAHGALVVPHQRPPARQGPDGHPRHRAAATGRSCPTAASSAYAGTPGSRRTTGARRPDGDVPRLLRGRPLRRSGRGTVAPPALLPRGVAGTCRTSASARGDAWAVADPGDRALAAGASSAPTPSASTGGVVTALDPGFSLENQTRPTTRVGVFQPADGPRARPPVVRRLGVGAPLARRLAQRGLRDLHGAPLDRGPTAASRPRRGCTAPTTRRSRQSFWDGCRRRPGSGTTLFDWRGLRARGDDARRAAQRIGTHDLRPPAAAVGGRPPARPRHDRRSSRRSPRSVSGQDLTSFFDAWLRPAGEARRHRRQRAADRSVSRMNGETSRAIRLSRPVRASSRSAERHRAQPGVDAQPAQRLRLPRA